MSEALDEAYRDLFWQMHQAWSDAPPPPPVRVPTLDAATAASADATVVLYGWTARVIRTGEAVLMLDAAGYVSETSPLIRSMIEHAIALAWLQEHRGDALQALVRKRAEAANRLRRAEKDGWDLSETVHGFIDNVLSLETEERTRPLDRLLHVAHQATEYGLGSLYQAWLIESDTAHPSIASALPYFEPPSDFGAPVQLRAEPRDVGAQRPAGVSVIVYVALQSYNQVLDDEDLSRVLPHWFTVLNHLGAQLAQENRDDETV